MVDNSVAASSGSASSEPSASVRSIRAELRCLFERAIKAAYGDLEEPAKVEPCSYVKHGDYKCTNAMALFAKLKKAGDAPANSRAVATAVLEELAQEDVPMIKETSVAGPGFINIRLHHGWLADHVRTMLVQGPNCTLPRVQKRVIIDYSSPNVAKELHVGHLRSTIIGETLARVLELCGADVLRLNHIGDWGTQFGMLITYMREQEGGDGLADNGNEESVSDLGALYKAARKRFDQDEAFKTRSRETVAKLQSGDPECVAAWQRICAASRAYFEALYERLEVSMTERGESFYNPLLHDTIRELEEKGLIEDDEGAKVVWVDEDREKTPPLMAQKSDGGFGYASTDLASIKHRLQVEKGDWLIYVTDVGQSLHFQQVFRAARMAGWLPPEGEPGPRVDHVPFGLVLGEDGKRLRARAGEAVQLIDLLDEARDKCAESITERRQEKGEEIDHEEVEKTAAAMGYGAVKYADLENSRLTNYKFSFDEMLLMKGNTAVYLLYAHARIAGIVRKSGKDIKSLAQAHGIVLDTQQEVALALHLAKFPEAIEDTLDELFPNRITDYLYNLSDAFNSFYKECKVLGSEQETSRLLLVEMTAAVMRSCLHLLGITPLYRI